jgi:hypothetical protein
MKEEILETIREELAKNVLPCLSKKFDIQETEGFDVYKDSVVYSLVGYTYIKMDLYKNEFSLEKYKFDMYKDPCPGLVSEKEEDITELCMSLIGDLKDILRIFKCDS